MAKVTGPAVVYGLLEGVIAHLRQENPDRNIEWVIEEDLPIVRGDAKSSRMAGRRIEEGAAHAVLDDFTRAYAAGDINALMRLFTRDAINNRGGRDAIAYDYQSLFAGSEARSLALADLAWVPGRRITTVNARFLAEVKRPGQWRATRSRGDIRFDIGREDGQALYGFAVAEEREFFKLLVEKVSGVGPKMALNILSRLALPILRDAIIRGDVALLSQCPGVGKKTAERLVMELKDKVGNLALGPAATAGAPALSEAEVNCLIFPMLKKEC